MDYEAKLKLGRDSYDAFNRRDLEALLQLYDPECEWHLSNYEGWPEKPVYEGHDGLSEFFETWLEPWEDFHAEVREAIELPGGRTFAEGYNSGRGRLSGTMVELPPIGQIIEYRGERILRVRNYSDVKMARRAAGLLE